MKLVPISANTLINPGHVGCVEQVVENGRAALYVYVDGYKYKYQYEDKVSIVQFLDIISQNLIDSPDHFAG